MDTNAKTTEPNTTPTPPVAGTPPQNGDDDVKARLEEFIDTDVRPFLQSDGGDIELVDIVDGIVKVRMHGACGTCPSSIMTLRMGVERRLLEVFPQYVKGLELIDSPLAGMGGMHGHGHGHF